MAASRVPLKGCLLRFLQHGFGFWVKAPLIFLRDFYTMDMDLGLRDKRL